MFHQKSIEIASLWATSGSCYVYEAAQDMFGSIMFSQSLHSRRALWLYVVPAFGLAVLLANQADAQPPISLEFGLRAGLPFHNIVESRLINLTGQQSTVQNSERPWIAVGPTFGVMLYDQVQIELGAIYKPVRFETNTLACANGDCTQRVPGITIHESVRGHLWEFPLTAFRCDGRGSTMVALAFKDPAAISLYSPSTANAARSANPPASGSTCRSVGLFTRFLF